MKTTLAALIALTCLCSGALSLEAQVDSNLLRREWREESHLADTYDKPLLIFRGDPDPNGNEYGVFHWDSYGRIKTSREVPAPEYWFGYKFLTMETKTEDTFLDHAMYDVGLAFAAKLGSIGDDWSLEAAGGLASANDGAWSNTNAIYPTATLAALHTLGAHESLQLGLTYDGNSALLPALPLPLVEYEARLSPSLRLRAGFPHCEVEVRPFQDFSILLIAEYPSDVRVHAEVDLGGSLRLYSEFVRRIDAFHLSDAGHERVFYQLHTVEAGFRYVKGTFDLTLAGGWAFSQEFFTGYDLRHRTLYVRPEDRPMIALTLQGTF